LARNNVTLDTSLTLEDRGVSGFTGEHRNNPDRYALAAFLALAKAKPPKVPEGSYLIVENLDRLSREDIVPALQVLLDLIQCGIRVVQLIPTEMVFDRPDPMLLMMAIMELARGHSESAMKSERIGRAWREKKRRAAESREPVTARTPAWLRLVNGQFQLKEGAVEIVRRIYQMATSGYGTVVITRRLNAEGVLGIGRIKHWTRSSVGKILTNRAVVGEYQPQTGRWPKQKPDGPPIPGYYPAIVSEEDWHAARAALISRRGKAGRPAKLRVNVFTGLLFDARDGGTMRIVNKGKKCSGPLLVSSKGADGLQGSRFVSFPLRTFERAILSQIREIDPKEILGKPKPKDATQALTDQIAAVKADIEQMKARLKRRYSEAVADVLEQQEEKLRSLEEQLAAAQREAAWPLEKAWHDCNTLLDALDTAPDQEDARTRLRAALRRIISSIWVYVVPEGKDRLAAVQVWFKPQEQLVTCRNYLILHRPAMSGARQRPSGWLVEASDEIVFSTDTADVVESNCDGVHTQRVYAREDPEGFRVGMRQFAVQPDGQWVEMEIPEDPDVQRIQPFHLRDKPERLNGILRLAAALATADPEILRPFPKE
jgi:DNA invertase Pin-like site-specific DNA recombinase